MPRVPRDLDDAYRDADGVWRERDEWIETSEEAARDWDARCWSPVEKGM